METVKQLETSIEVKPTSKEVRFGKKKTIFSYESTDETPQEIQ